MRRARGMLLGALVLLVASPLALASTEPAPADALVPLYAHWQAPVGASFGGHVVLDERPPEGEPDLSEGPALPGAASAGTLPAFTYALTTWFGDQGPLGTLDMAPDRAAVLTLFLSADQTAWPSLAGPSPADVDVGIAPIVTVDVVLRVGDEVVGHGSLTRDLVSLPAPAGETVHRLDVPAPFERVTVAPGEGVFADVTIYQVDADGERVMQNLFNLHTGEAYPTGLALPITNPRALYVPDDLGGPALVDDLARTTGMDEVDPGTVRTTAAATLGAALAVAAVAGVQLVRQVRR